MGKKVEIKGSEEKRDRENQIELTTSGPFNSHNNVNDIHIRLTTSHHMTRRPRSSTIPNHRLTPIQQHRSSSLSSCVKQTKQQWSIFWKALNSALLSSFPPSPAFSPLCVFARTNNTQFLFIFFLSLLSPFIVACSTVTVTKCQAALRTLQAFPFFRPTCLCKEPSVDPDCNYFRDFLFDHPCGFVLKKGKPRSWEQKKKVLCDKNRKTQPG